MDLQQLNTNGNATHWLHVLLSDRTLAYSDAAKTLPVRIQLKSKDSPEYEAEQARQVQQAQKKNRQFNGKYDPPLEEIKANNRRLYAAVTVDFENLTDGGQPLDAADAEKLYEQAPDVFEQVQAFVDDRANFTSGALTA